MLGFWPVDRQAVAAEWQGPALPSRRAAALGRGLSLLNLAAGPSVGWLQRVTEGQQWGRACRRQADRVIPKSD